MALETLQENLGELNDWVMAPGILERFGIEAPPPFGGKQEYKHLLARVGNAYEALIDTKRFWR